MSLFDEQYQEGQLFDCGSPQVNTLRLAIWINTERRDPSSVAEEIADLFLEICREQKLAGKWKLSYSIVIVRYSNLFPAGAQLFWWSHWKTGDLLLKVKLELIIIPLKTPHASSAQMFNGIAIERLFQYSNSSRIAVRESCYHFHKATTFCTCFLLLWSFQKQLAFAPLYYNAFPNIWKLRVSANVSYSYNCGCYYIVSLTKLPRPIN